MSAPHPPCENCELLEADLIEMRFRLRVALGGVVDGDINAPLPEWVLNPAGIRNHERMGEK